MLRMADLQDSLSFGASPADPSTHWFGYSTVCVSVCACHFGLLSMQTGTSLKVKHSVVICRGNGCFFPTVPPGSSELD